MMEKTLKKCNYEKVTLIELLSLSPPFLFTLIKSKIAQQFLLLDNNFCCYVISPYIPQYYY